MKAHTNYTTPVTTATWHRQGAALLLAGMAPILGLMLLWRANGHLALPAVTSNAIARPASGPIASCRACRDEWVAAQSAPAPIAASTRGVSVRPQSASVPIGSCRICRDEWIAATTAQSIPAAISASSSGHNLEQPMEQIRISGPR
jgi:hypothetical protein